jgi:uncharacterized protein
MPTEPTRLTIEIGDDSVSGLLYLAAKKDRAGMTFILGHGAGVNQLQSFMVLFARGLAERGIDCLTFNFPYMEQGRKIPDKAEKLEACFRAVIAAASAHKTLKGNRVAIGGKSMGGRIASQVAAAGDAGEIAGLVFLGYPLHPPGRPEKMRDKHLPDIKSPMLFIQGSRDTFGTEDEIRAVVKRLKLPATLYFVKDGDHSLKAPKSAGVPQPQIYENAMDHVAEWLRRQKAVSRRQ